MYNTQRNSVRTSTVFYKLVEGVQEVRTGSLLKSPPAKKFKTLRSWKRRFFVLFRINEKEHVLKYFRNVDDRDKPLGGIEISQISMIYSGPQTNSKWHWIHKTFKCDPASVLFIRTPTRDYFLIDENDNVEGWFQDISKLLLKNSDSQPSPKGPELCQWLKQGSELCCWEKECSGRSFSDPVPPLTLSHKDAQNCTQDKGQEKSRPISDPVLDSARVKLYQDAPLHFGADTDTDTYQCTSDAVYEKYKANLRRCSSADSSSSDQSTSEQSGAFSSEPIYDTPRNLFKNWIQDSIDPEEENQNEEAANSFYMKMDPVYEVLNMTQEGTEKTSAIISDTEEEPQSQSLPVEKTKVTPADMLLNWAIKNKSSPSSRPDPQNHSNNDWESEDIREITMNQNDLKAHLTLVEVDGKPCDWESEDIREITVNRNDLKAHLTLVEVDGKPCISDWPALPETKCLFRKGDQILAINDLLAESVEEVQTYLSKLFKDQAKVTVLRHPGSDSSLPNRRDADPTVE